MCPITEDSALPCSGMGTLHGKPGAGPGCWHSGQAHTTPQVCAVPKTRDAEGRSSSVTEEEVERQGPSKLPTATQSANYVGTLKPRSAGPEAMGPSTTGSQHGHSPTLMGEASGCRALRTTLTSVPRAGHVRGKAASEANPSKEDTLGLLKVVLIHVDR